MSSRVSAEQLNNCANSMLDEIIACVKEEINSTAIRLESAIVKNVNSDGTVDIYLPSDEKSVFTNIQNQSVYQDLQIGDGVEVLLKNGKFSNCWIVGKHKGFVNAKLDTEEIVAGMVGPTGPAGPGGGGMSARVVNHNVIFE